MNEKTRQQIIKQETSAFLDSQFAPLDLSGSPSFEQVNSEDQFATSDRKGLSNVDFGQSNPLKAFAENPDAETLDRIAAETGDPELADKLRDEREGAEADAFVASHPTYYRCDENFEAIKDYLDERKLTFSRDNLHNAFVALSRAGELQMQPGTAKGLTQPEKLHVISLCKAGQVEDAISQFLGYSLPDAPDHWADETAFMSDPNTLNVRNRAVHFCWQQSRPVMESSEWFDFVRQYFKNRPIRTVADYDQAWVLFQQSQRTAFRNTLVSGNRTEVSPTPENLDDLSDDQIEKLTTATRRHRARSSRRGTGILA